MLGGRSLKCTTPLRSSRTGETNLRWRSRTGVPPGVGVGVAGSTEDGQQERSGLVAMSSRFTGVWLTPLFSFCKTRFHCKYIYLKRKICKPPSPLVLNRGDVLMLTGFKPRPGGAPGEQPSPRLPPTPPQLCRHFVGVCSSDLVPECPLPGVRGVEGTIGTRAPLPCQEGG